MLLRSVQPVHHDHVGVGLSLVQRCHQLGDPTLKQPSHLGREHTHSERAKDHATRYGEEDLALTSCSSFKFNNVGGGVLLTIVMK